MCQTFGKHFVLFFLLTTLLFQKIQNLIKRTFLFCVSVYIKAECIKDHLFREQRRIKDNKSSEAVIQSPEAVIQSSEAVIRRGAHMSERNHYKRAGLKQYDVKYQTNRHNFMTAIHSEINPLLRLFIYIHLSVAVHIKSF